MYKMPLVSFHVQAPFVQSKCKRKGAQTKITLGTNDGNDRNCKETASLSVLKAGDTEVRISLWNQRPVHCSRDVSFIVKVLC